MIRWLLIVLSLCSASGVWAQAFEQEMGFVNHLQQSDQEKEALFVLSQLEQKNLSTSQLDLIRYRQGFLHYSLRDFDAAVSAFKQVSEQAESFAPASFFGGISLCYAERYSEASSLLLQRQPLLATNHDELLRFQLAGYALLQHDIPTFDSIAAAFENSDFAYGAQQAELLKVRDELAQTKRRSPVLAGVMSAAVPGLGKVYAGKTAQGITNFLVSGLLGVSAWEQYTKVGPNSAQFYLFAGLFSAFYIGNIYGSVYSVNVRYNENVENLHNEIVFQLHLPVRALFN